MTDYKELFYRSQAMISDMIDNMEEMTKVLKNFMSECENEVISEDNRNPQTIIKN